MAKVKVPNIVSMPVAAAIRDLSAAKLQAGAVTVEESASVQAGNVVRTTPEANAETDEDALIEITLSAGKRTKLGFVVDNFQSIVFNIMALALGGAAWYAGGTGLLDSLANMDVARGLVTFLITVTACGLFIIMTISTIVLDDEKRFDRGKQLLSMLVGILGTVAGYYYAASNQAGLPARGQTLKIAGVTSVPAAAKIGTQVTLSAVITGGKPPYKYSIAFVPPLSIPAVNNTSADGKIEEKITVPADLPKDTTVAYSIGVEDSDKKTITAGEKTQTIGMTVK